MGSGAIGVGIIGLGTVGSGVVRLLEDAPTSMRRREHAVFSIERVAVRDLAKERDVKIDPSKLTDDPTAVLDDPNVQLVVELAGAEPAYEWVRGALERGQPAQPRQPQRNTELGVRLCCRLS